MTPILINLVGILAILLIASAEGQAEQPAGGRIACLQALMALLVLRTRGRPTDPGAVERGDRAARLLEGRDRGGVRADGENPFTNTFSARCR